MGWHNASGADKDRASHTRRIRNLQPEFACSAVWQHYDLAMRWRWAEMFAVTSGRAVLVSLEIGKGGGRFSPASRDGTEGNGRLQSVFAIPLRGRTLVRKIP